MPDLPTEAEVAAMRKHMATDYGKWDPCLSTRQQNGLLALVEAWAPIVEETASTDPITPDHWHLIETQARDLWRRWKGETHEP